MYKNSEAIAIAGKTSPTRGTKIDGRFKLIIEIDFKKWKNFWTHWHIYCLNWMRKYPEGLFDSSYKSKKFREDILIFFGNLDFGHTRLGALLDEGCAFNPWAPSPLRISRKLKKIELFSWKGTYLEDSLFFWWRLHGIILFGAFCHRFSETLKSFSSSCPQSKAIKKRRKK